MATVKIFKYNGGQHNIYIERYGYCHKHSNVTPSSINRLSKLCRQGKRHSERCGNALYTEIQLGR